MNEFIKWELVCKYVRIYFFGVLLLLCGFYKYGICGEFMFNVFVKVGQRIVIFYNIDFI